MWRALCWSALCGIPAGCLQEKRQHKFCLTASRVARYRRGFAARAQQSVMPDSGVRWVLQTRIVARGYERRFCKPLVGSSILSPGTSKIKDLHREIRNWTRWNSVRGNNRGNHRWCQQKAPARAPGPSSRERVGLQGTDGDNTTSGWLRAPVNTKVRCPRPRQWPWPTWCLKLQTLSSWLGRPSVSPPPARAASAGKLISRIERV